MHFFYEYFKSTGYLSHKNLSLLLIFGFAFVTWRCHDATAQKAEIKLNESWEDADEIVNNKAQLAHESPWFIMPTFLNVYPKLESELLINRYYSPAMRILAPGFRDMRTVSSLRDEHLLWTPSISIGRVVSRRLALYMQFAYSAGKVRTKKRDMSVLLLPLHTDFEIFRSAAYVGLCADIFPWGMPVRKEYHGLWERLRNTKPSVVLRVTETYAGYKVKIKNGFMEYGRFLNLELSDNLWITSFNANIGADIPLDKDNVLSINAGYNFASPCGYDFDGASFTIGWKRYFK